MGFNSHRSNSLLASTMLLIYISVNNVSRAVDYVQPPNSIDLPSPQYVCIPRYSGEGCYHMTLMNLHAVPEENRVVLLFTSSERGYFGVHGMRFGDSDEWACIFDQPHNQKTLTNIQYLNPRSTSERWYYHTFNSVAAAQCRMPPATRDQLLLGHNVNMTVRMQVLLGNKQLTKTHGYTLQVHRWKHKKLFGMCSSTPPFGLSKTTLKFAQWFEHYIYLANGSASVHSWRQARCNYDAGETRLASSKKVSSKLACKRSCEDAAACRSVTFYTSGWCSHYSTECRERTRDDKATSIRLSRAEMSTHEMSTHFFIYMFKSTNAVVDGLAFFTPYIRMGVVTIVWVPAETRRHYAIGGGRRNYELQQVMGNDCLYRYKYAAAWVAPFIDIDEFVGPMPPSILPKELMRDDSISPEIKAGAQVGWRSCSSGTPAQSFQLTKYGKLRIGNNLCVGIRDGSLELHKCTYEDDADSEIWTKRIISGKHFDLRVGNQCLDLFGPTLWSCKNYTGAAAANDQQTFHHQNGHFKIASSSKKKKHQCLSVINPPLCRVKPEACGRQHIKLGPPPLNLPPFADVLSEVPRNTLQVFVPKWPASSTVDAYNEQSSFLDVKLVSSKTSSQMGKYFARPANVTIAWIHHVLAFESSVEQVEGKPRVVPRKPLQTSSSNTHEVVPYVALHFSKSGYKRFLNNTLRPPVSYRYFEEESKIVKKRMRKRFENLAGLGGLIQK